jgi:hypothetical protein
MLIPDQDKVDKISSLVSITNPENLGDIFEEAIRIRATISNEIMLKFSEIPMRKLRALASRAPVGSPLFSTPILPTRTLNDIEILQLIGLEFALHELGYCCERLQDVADITWGGSSPTRFYLNGIYYYVTSLFLVDKTKPNHAGLPMGGTAILALNPLGLSNLLLPVDSILGRRFGRENTFGDAIRKLRNTYLVHGDFSPEQLETLIVDTQMRDPAQQERLAANIWDLFHEVLLIDLRITSILANINPDLSVIIARYATAH